MPRCSPGRGVRGIPLTGALCNGKSVCIQTKTSGHEPDCPTTNLVKV